MDVAESPSRSAIGEAIRPNAYPVPELSDLDPSKQTAIEEATRERCQNS
jgi:hypothetical protein